MASLPELVRKFGAPDFVIASGDIAFSGKPDEYKSATELFDRILDILGLSRKDLFVVPGNHDVDRTKGAGLARTLSSTEEANRYFSADNSLMHIEYRLSGFGDWYDSYFSGVRKFARNSTVILERIEIRHTSIDIGLFNTATFCVDDSDNGQLFIGRRSLDQLSSNLAQGKKSNLRIAVMHHPFSWLSPIEVTHVKASVRDLFDCVLTGHLHENEIENVIGSSGDGLHLAAGASYQTRRWPNLALFCSATQASVVVTPIRYNDTPRPVWTLDTALFAKSDDYRHEFALNSCRNLDIRVQSNGAGDPSQTGSNSLSRAESAKIVELRKQLQDSLFVTPKGHVVYAEPRLMPRPQMASLDTTDQSAVSIDEIVHSSDSYIIATRPEYGGSTFCSSLELAFEQSSLPVLSKNARHLPNYKKKLEVEFDGHISTSEATSTLILDDFDLERDERLLREIFEGKWFKRVILISVNRRLAEAILPENDEIPFKPAILHLWAMGRDAIRQFASVVLDANDLISESKAVDKVYSDLLALRIPLTPSNVLMYLRVLQREGDFEPLSRVDILSRYLAESLRKPSDVAVDSFNFKNKMDVLSAFAYKLHCESLETFDERYWLNFCSDYQERTLTEFDGKKLLHELVEVRILATFQNGVYFKYSFFFNFFLGRYLWPRPDKVNDFFESNDYLISGSVIDVITGLSSENSAIVELLLKKLNVHLDEFGRKYVRPDFDPLAGAIWPSNDDEEESLWIPVQKAITKGPADRARIDELKTSMLAEARTSNQRITFQKFTELENALFSEAYTLADALKNADDIDRSLKLEAWISVLKAILIVFQVGTMFAPALAKRKSFQWGMISFIDFDKAAEGLEENSHEAFVSVITHLSDSIAGKTAQDYGATKLSAVFRALSKEESLSGFMTLVNFACLATARGRDWSDACQEIIERTDKNAFYLRAQLDQLMSLLEFDLMTGHDREKMKRLVALIQAKRSFGKQTPGAKAVLKMVGHLEKEAYFPVAAPESAKDVDEGPKCSDPTV